VLKPRRGTGGCGVALACDEAHARRAFEALQAPFSPDDEVAAAPLLQEYLAGEEWVVDTASRDGEHKAVALWRYSKGPANGAPFVYRYDELMPAAGEREARLVEYALGVLEAVGWRWGPCHIELKQTSRGPAIVEVNAGRCNGVSFASLTGPCVGYTQYDAAFASLADDDTAWRALPPLPPPSLRSSARLVKLVATRAGRLRRLDPEVAAAMRALPSVRQLEPRYTARGEQVCLTTDLPSAAGYVLLRHANHSQVEEDCRTIEELQSGLLLVE